MPTLRERFRWHSRNRLWNIDRDARWIDGIVPYYEREGVVDRYDVPRHIAGETAKLSTFKDPISFELAELARQRGCRSYLDLGCGAGAFYFLLNKLGRPFTYTGYDASHAQVARACQLYGADFSVRDISTLAAEEIARFDAVHTYSVLSFMSAAGQEHLLRAIMKSRAWTIQRFSTTERSPAFVPRNAFTVLGKVRDKDGSLLSTLGFPLRETVERIVALNPDYEVIHEPAEFSVSPAVDPKGRQGSCYVTADRLKANRRAASARLGQDNPTRLKAYRTTIKPKDFDLTAVVPIDLFDDAGDPPVIEGISAGG